MTEIIEAIEKGDRNQASGIAPFARPMVSVYRGARLIFFLTLASFLVPFRLAQGASNLSHPSKLTMLFHRLLATGLRLKVECQGDGFTQGQLVVSNHISWSDIIVLGSVSGTTFVAKSEVRDWPIIGWLAHIAPTLFIRRLDRGDIAQQIRTVSDALNKGPVVLFPEGTSTSGATVLPFKSALLQAAAGRVLVPVTLVYRPSGKARWTAKKREAFAWDGDKTFWPHFLSVMWGESMTCQVIAHAPIAFDGDRKAAASLCHAAVTAGLASAQRR